MSATASTTILVLQVIAIVLLFVESMYILSQAASRVRTELIVLTVSTIIMMIGYIIEVKANCLEAALIGTTISYIGKPFALISSALFIASYCGYKANQWVILALVVIGILFPVLIYTNGYHHLYYATTEFNNTNGMFSPLVLTRGPLYYLYMVYMFGILLFELFITINELRHCKSKVEKIQILYIFAMLAVTVLGFIIFASGVTKGYDSTMAGSLAGAIILSVLFVRYRLLDVVAMAKEVALNESTGGILVVDQRGRKVYSNTIVDKLIDKEVINVKGVGLMDDESIIRTDDTIYSVKKHDLFMQDRKLGSVVEVSDITVTFSYAERLEKDVKKRADEITHIQRSVIGGLANIVEVRNGETGEHIKRTGAYVDILARKLKDMGKYTDLLTEEYIKRLQDAAPLHDIGKVVIPDSILMKPEKLTKEEFDIMKEHAEAGVDIIEKTMRGIESNEYVSCAEEMAMYHHEKWDGSGYPHGIVGESIPLSARIMAVADVYDALRSERCYKQPYDKDKSRKIIVEGSGSHFDPQIVSAFLVSIEDIENV